MQVSTSHDPVEFGRDDADLAVHYGARIGEGLEGELLFREMLLPVCSAELVRDGPVKGPRDLANRVLLHSVRRPEDWPHWFRFVGLPGIRIPQEIVLDNSIFTCQAAMDGLGIAIAQAAFVAQGLWSGRLVAPLRTTLETENAYYLVYPRERARQRKIRLFQAWITREAMSTRKHDLFGSH